LLDFFGAAVKANDLLSRVQVLQLLAKRISHYENPIAQFRVLTDLKPSNWSKGCGWNQSTCFLFFVILSKRIMIDLFPLAD